MSLDPRGPPFRAASMQLTGGATDGGTLAEVGEDAEADEVMMKVWMRRERKKRESTEDHHVVVPSGVVATGDPHVAATATMDPAVEAEVAVVVPWVTANCRTKREKRTACSHEDVVADTDADVAPCTTDATTAMTMTDTMTDHHEDGVATVDEGEGEDVDEEGEDVELAAIGRRTNSIVTRNRQQPPRLSRRRSLRHLRLPPLHQQQSRVPATDRRVYRSRHAQRFAETATNKPEQHQPPQPTSKHLAGF